MNTIPRPSEGETNLPKRAQLSISLKKHWLSIVTALVMATPTVSSAYNVEGVASDALLGLKGIIPNEQLSEKTHRWMDNAKKMLQYLEEAPHADMLQITMLREYLEGLVTMSVTGDKQTNNIKFSFIDKAPTSSTPLYILPFTKEIQNDPTLSEDWKNSVMGPTTFASYAVDYDMTFIRDDADTKVTATWQTITVLHEVLHAFQQQFRKGENSSLMETALDEVDAHMLEHSIFQMLGGEAYNDLLRKQVSDLTTFYAKTGQSPNTLIIPPPHDPRIDIVFGKPSSDIERRLRETLIHLQAYFQYIIWKYNVPEDRRMEAMAAFYVDWNKNIERHHQISIEDKNLMPPR